MRRFPDWPLIGIPALAIVATFLLTTCIMTGCATTPRGRYAEMQDLYISAVTVLIEARDQGTISPAVWQNEVLPLINLGDKLLDEYAVLTQTGQPTDNVAARLRDVLIRLQPFIVKVRQNE